MDLAVATLAVGGLLPPGAEVSGAMQVTSRAKSHARRQRPTSAGVVTLFADPGGLNSRPRAACSTIDLGMETESTGFRLQPKAVTKQPAAGVSPTGSDSARRNAMESRSSAVALAT